MTKKYYWLKLKDDFFDKKEIKRLRRMAGGDTYTIIYLKMLLLSLKDEGNLFFDDIGDDFIDELSLVLDEDMDDTKMTLAYLKSKNLIEIVSDKEYHLNELPYMIGSESDSAVRMRRHRLRKKKEEEKTLQSDEGASHSDNPVTKGDTEIDIELDIELEKDKESPSISKVQEIYNHYLSKNIVQHRKITSDMRTAINARLKDYTYEEIIQAIDNYATIFHDNDYWFDTRYTLADLMRPKDVRKFIDEAEPLNNYKNKASGFNKGSGFIPMEQRYDPNKDAF